MKWIEFLAGLPFIVAGMVANFAARWFIAGWVFAREFLND